jgi:hypothetical protein
LEEMTEILVEPVAKGIGATPYLLGIVWEEEEEEEEEEVERVTGET